MSTRPPFCFKSVIVALVTLALGGVSGWWMGHRSADEAATLAAARTTAAEGAGKPRPSWAETRDEMASLHLTAQAKPGSEPCERGGCGIRHTPVADGHVQLEEGGREVVLYATIVGDGGAHPVKVAISLVEFEGSKLVRSFVHFTEAGTYGRPFESGERYSIVPINQREYAVVIEDRDLAFGQVTGRLSVHVVGRSGIKSGFSADTEDDRSGMGSGPNVVWRTGWTLVDVPFGRPELFLAKRGVDDGRFIDAVERYRWNGTDFTPVPLAGKASDGAAAEAAVSSATAASVP